MTMPARVMTMERSLPAAVDRLLQETVAQVEPAGLRDVLAGAVAGGKRIRPVLTGLACAAAGGDEHLTVRAGAALELLHTSSLVHDDIMDRAETRRGTPTVVHTHGIAMAILAGDALVALAFRLIQSADHARKDEIQAVFTSAFLNLCEGQCADVCNAIGTPGEQCTHMWMVERKTARLIEACTKIGGLIAGAPAPHVQTLAQFGLSLGLAYQATDDLLDATGNEAETGKPVGIDARNGRATYLTLAYPDRDGVEEIRGVIARYTADALRALDGLPPSDASARLRGLALHLLDRRG